VPVWAGREIQVCTLTSFKAKFLYRTGNLLPTITVVRIGKKVEKAKTGQISTFLA
jgi:hypothetical protein